MSIKNWIFPTDPKWLYFTTPDNKARFVLGKVLDSGPLPPPAWGATKKSLICFGVNPSTAEPNDPDNTIKKLEGFATTHGYDSWIMLNIYPQRATDPDDLDPIMNPAYHAENLRVIQTVLNEVQGDLLAAWGDSIENPSYLRDCCLQNIVPISGNNQWHSFGVTQKGNPRNILYLPVNSLLLPFDMAAYLAGQIVVNVAPRQLTKQVLGSLSYSNIIYAEDWRASWGGLTVYVSAKGQLIPYNIDGDSIENILRNKNLFNEHYAGMGNCVFINRKVCFEVLDDGRFLYKTNNNVYKISFPLDFNVKEWLNKLNKNPKLAKDPFYKQVKENFYFASNNNNHTYMQGSGSHLKRQVGLRQSRSDHSKNCTHKQWMEDFIVASNNRDSNRLHELRQDIFQETLSIVKKGGYPINDKFVIIPNKRAQEQAEFFTAPFTLEPNVSTISTRFAAIEADCLETAYILKYSGYNPCVLNMASRQNPGGGVMSGAGAQEENLFRRTNLFLSLYQYSCYADKYKDYGIVKSKHQYPLDRTYGGVYSGGIAVFRKGESLGYQLMEAPFQTAFVTVPAMNRPELEFIDGKWFITKTLVEPVKEKIRTMLRITGKHNHDSLVLGAWGCGAFCNPPNHIALLFKEVFNETEFMHRFSLVLFSIISDHNSNKEHNPNGNLQPFIEVFN